MDIGKIRRTRNAAPFKPFLLVLDDGRGFVIEKPYYLGISPKEDLLLVSSSVGTAWFGPQRVVDAIPLGSVAA